MSGFAAVDAHLVSAWADRVLNAARPVLRVPGVRPTERERAALGAGFAQVRAAVLGEHVQQVLPGRDNTPEDDENPEVAGDLERYLVGLAAGIEATGADRDPMSLVAGLIAGAAALQYSRAGSAGDDPPAAEVAARAGVAAADLAAEGADLSTIVEAAAGVANSGWPLAPQPGVRQTAEFRLRALIGMLLAALAQLVGAGDDDIGVAGCGAGPGEHSGRRFLAEVTFEFHGDAAARARLQQLLVSMGTDLRVWPQEDRAEFHLHTVHPADVVAEVYSVGTPFDLRIGTLEPPLSVAHGRMDDESHG